MMIATTAYAGRAFPDDHPHARDLTETLTQRIALLAGEDRVLMALYLHDGHTFGQIARLTGACPTTIARRIRRIARQLTDETYPLCLAHKSEFNRSELAIVRDHFVRGRTVTQISRTRGITYYRVRTTILKARELVSSVTAVCPSTSEEDHS